MTADGRARGALPGYAERLGAASDAAPVRLAEDPHPAQVGVRVATGTPAAGRLVAVLGVALPAAGAVASSGALHVLWLGPDEYLAVAPAGEERALEERARGALAGEGAVVDLSANRTALRVEGVASRDLLASCCALDLDPPAFGPGRCAPTLVARAQAVVWQTSGEPAFALLVRPSFAAYVAEWLLDGARGLG